MEFWGVEVKPGQTLKCEPGEDRFLHLSQAALGETKKASENVPVFVKFNDQKLTLGTLSGDKCPQVQYDLVFEKEFELSHSSKSTSVFFCGYKTLQDDGSNFWGLFTEDFSDSEFDEGEFRHAVEELNGKPEVKEAKAKISKLDGPSAKPKVKAEEAKKVAKPKVNEDGDEGDDSDDESDDFELPDAEDDSDDEDDEDADSSDEDVTPKKADIGKKRPADSTSKTPPPEKKAKLITPVGGQKTGGDNKKGVHVATPHPAKQVGKTAVIDGKAKQQTPKSGGSIACKACSKTFNSDNALQAHTKAKHTAA